MCINQVCVCGLTSLRRTALFFYSIFLIKICVILKCQNITHLVQYISPVVKCKVPVTEVGCLHLYKDPGFKLQTSLRDSQHEGVIVVLETQ